METVQKTTTTKTTKTVTTQETTGEIQTSQSDAGHSTHNIQISKRGLFFNDDTFADTRQDFADAIKDVLSKFGDKSITASDDINSYRNLRTQNLKDENQAIKSSDDQQFHKIVVDVQDFVGGGGEVSVKLVEEVEVVVEGKVEKVEGNSRSFKSFKRSFTLPDDVDASTLTSVISADGVLIIKVRKIETEEDQGETHTIIKKTITTTKKAQQQQQETNQQQQIQQQQQQTISRQQTTDSNISRQVTDSTGAKNLPIAKKGGFFDDSFFEDTRQEYTRAIKQVLEKCNINTTGQTDDFNKYRSLRQQELKEETQAVTECDKEDVHKIIVDVQDFLNGGEVNVKTVNENEVVIEGRIEKVEGNKKSIKKFCKRFILEDDIQTDQVTSVVSSDGVLTITAPRKPQHQQQIQQGETTTTTKTHKQTTITSQQESQEQQQQAQDTQVQVNVTKTVTETQEQIPVQEETKTQETRVTKTQVTETQEQIPVQEKTKTQETRVTKTQVTETQEQIPVQEETKTQETRVTKTQVTETQEQIPVQEETKTQETRVTKTQVETQEIPTQETKTQETRVTKTQVTETQEQIPVQEETQVQVNITKTVTETQEQIPVQETQVKTNVTETQVAETQETPKETQVKETPVQETQEPVPSPETQQPTQQSIEQTVQKTTKTQQQTTIQSGQQDVQNTNVQTQDTRVQTQNTQVQQNVGTDENVSSTTTKTTKTVTIIEKGGFFDDACFEDTREDYQKAVKQVLEKSNINTTSQDVLNTYRTLRQTDLRDDNQAVTECDKDDIHKIIVDVQDFFKGGEVTVKTVNENEVVVEGRIEKVEGNKKSIKKFCKRFILEENIIVETITSVVSSDGILTITARRKPSDDDDEEEEETITTKTTKTTKTITSGGQDTDQTKTITTTQKQDTTKQDTTKQDTTVQKQDTTKTTTQKTDINVQKTDINVQKTDTNVQKTDTTTQKTETQKTDVQKTDDQATTVTKIIKKVTIIKRGTFFEDSVFKETVQHYKTAVRQVLKKLNITCTESEEINKYRSVREKEVKNETQALTQCDTNDTHSIVVDVQDFTSGDVEVKTVDNKEIVIEGKTDKKSFTRRFTPPSDVDLSSVTADQSSDGVLCITIRRKVTKTTTTSKQVIKKVTITKRGSFFQDTVFTQTVQHYKTAVRQVLKKLNITCTESEEINKYRSVREKEVKNETQALTQCDTQDSHSIVVDVQDFTSGEVEVKTVDNKEVVIEGKTDKRSFTRRFTPPSDVDMNTVTADQSSDGVLCITVRRTVTKTTIKKTEGQKSDESSSNTKIIKVTIKGPFFSDPEFKETKEEFVSSIKTITEKFKIEVTKTTDVYTAYREYRKKNPKNENQAISTVDNDKFMRIVMDVVEFMSTVQVKLVDGKEIVVDGKGNREQGGQVVSFSFTRRFMLYEDSVFDAITATMSNEGILVINVPRKQ